MSREKNFTNDHIFEGKMRDYEKRLIDLIIGITESKERSSTIYKIIGYLLIHGSLTQKQLKDLTGFSLGKISANLNAMVSAGGLEKNLIKGTHTYAYSSGGDISQVLSRTSFLKFDTNVKLKEFVEAKIAELEKEELQSKSGCEILLKRMYEMRDFVKLHRKLLEALTSSDIAEKLSKGQFGGG
jgi:DNA-binding transcriptional regulator GbsR (MarR family)